MFSNYGYYITLATIGYFISKVFYNKILKSNLKTSKQEINDYAIGMILLTISYYVTGMNNKNIYNQIFMSGFAIGLFITIGFNKIEEVVTTKSVYNKNKFNNLKYAFYIMVIISSMVITFMNAPNTTLRTYYILSIISCITIFVFIIITKHKDQYIYYDNAFIIWVISLFLVFNDTKGVIVGYHGFISAAFISFVASKGIRYIIANNNEKTLNSCDSTVVETETTSCDSTTGGTNINNFAYTTAAAADNDATTAATTAATTDASACIKFQDLKTKINLLITNINLLTNASTTSTNSTTCPPITEDASLIKDIEQLIEYINNNKDNIQNTNEYSKINRIILICTILLIAFFVIALYFNKENIN
jgi:hypothetical protein